jgi:O-antigen/teichoic acid export membrane protein
MGKRQFAYLALKGVNLLLTTALNFGLVYVLIRKLSLTDYSAFVLMTAIGSYVLAADLGFSSVVYQRVRSAFLAGRARDGLSLAVTTFGLYLCLALGTAAIAFGMLTVKDGASGAGQTLGVYFLALLLALPWMIVRSTANAVDRFLIYEATEAARRMVLIILAAAMLRWLPFGGYAISGLVLWLGAYAVVLPPLSRALGGAPSAKHWAPGEAFRDNAAQLKRAGVFSIMEFAIYNFPYLITPLLFGKGHALVAFDVFFKITRFAAVAYLVPSEALLPATTRAVHEADGRKLLKLLALVFGLSLAACLVAAIAVTVFGDALFGLLLGNRAVISPTVRICMAVILFAMMIQAPAGLLLLNTGRSAMLARIAPTVAAAMTVMCVAVAVTHASFDTFLVGYVSIFAIGAVVYFTLLVTHVRRLLRPGGQW